MKLLVWITTVFYWGLPFLGFVVTALLVQCCAKYSVLLWKVSVQLFVLYTLAVSGIAGVTQREAWPISNWKVFASPYTPPVKELIILAVDRQGTEHLIDRRAWEPFDHLQLHSWLHIHIPRLDPVLRTAICHDLLERANTARARAVARQSPGSDDRWLGRLAAPRLMTYAHLWSTPEQTPPEPFQRLRFYEEIWEAERRQQAPQDFQRRLLFEYVPL